MDHVADPQMTEGIDCDVIPDTSPLPNLPKASVQMIPAPRRTVESSKHSIIRLLPFDVSFDDGESFRVELNISNRCVVL